ncbi:hypothetical protein BDF22DRAFT_662196 [Syncephalis plumigaleata]|nr:hypothetical protein BDF22DRAFT_662196 [Syncephalis plumigaleata]
MFTCYLKAPVAVLLSISMMMTLTVDVSPVAAQRRGNAIRLNSCPNGIKPRREIRTLSTSEREAYIAAIKEMQKGTRPTRYDEFAQVHNEARVYAHNNALFFPWHRYYLALYEHELQQSNKDVMLPYWDWSIDSQAPSTSIIFRPDYFGGDGRDGDHCVEDGPFAEATIYYPRPGCLTRNFQQFRGAIDNFYSPEALQGIITRSRSYNDFRRQIEGAPHGAVHSGIGGAMATMYSPNDPIFFMHHAMVDRLWMRWQRANPRLAHTYNGPSSSNSNGATLDEIIRPWSGVRARDVFDTRALCYTYDDLTADDVSNTGNGEPGTDKKEAPSSESGDKTPKKEQAWRSGDFEQISGADKKKKKNKKSKKSKSRRRRSNDHYSSRHLVRREDEPAPADNATKAAAPADNVTKAAPANNVTAPVPANDAAAAAPAAPANNAVTSEAHDEKALSLTKTMMPNPIPEEWIAAHGYQLQVIRQDEAFYKREFYDRINAIPGYVSPCALGNRADQLAQLLAAGHTSFVATTVTTNAPIPVAIPANITNPEVDPREAAIELRKVTATIIESKDTANNTAATVAARNVQMVETKLTEVIGDSKAAGIQQGSLLDLNTVSKENWTADWKEALPYWSSSTTVSVAVEGNRTTTRVENKTEGHSDNASFQEESFEESFEEKSS